MGSGTHNRYLRIETAPAEEEIWRSISGIDSGDAFIVPAECWVRHRLVLLTLADVPSHWIWPHAQRIELGDDVGQKADVGARLCGGFRRAGHDRDCDPAHLRQYMMNVLRFMTSPFFDL